MQIIEHQEAKGVVLAFHYSIRSKNRKDKKMVISRIVENVTENDMRIFIKTRIESSRSENDSSLGRTRLSGSLIFGEQSDPLPEDVL